jgi:hypothetical protein
MPRPKTTLALGRGLVCVPWLSHPDAKANGAPAANHISSFQDATLGNSRQMRTESPSPTSTPPPPAASFDIGGTLVASNDPHVHGCRMVFEKPRHLITKIGEAPIAALIAAAG